MEYSFWYEDIEKYTDGPFDFQTWDYAKCFSFSSVLSFIHSYFRPADVAARGQEGGCCVGPLGDKTQVRMGYVLYSIVEKIEKE